MSWYFGGFIYFGFLLNFFWYHWRLSFFFFLSLCCSCCFPNFLELFFFRVGWLSSFLKLSIILCNIFSLIFLPFQLLLIFSFLFCQKLKIFLLKKLISLLSLPLFFFLLPSCLFHLYLQILLQFKLFILPK